jgi:PE-PPE domain
MSGAGVLTGALVVAPYSVSMQSAAHKAFEDMLLAAASIVFIDGHDYPNGSTRMAGILGGQYQCTTTSCAPLTTPAPSDQLIFINNTAEYPGTLGLIDGLGAPTGDQSVADGQQGIAARLPEPSSSDTVTVVAFSEGAVAASHEISALGPSDNVNFVLAGNPERPNGGILARFPAGTPIPILGITGGAATAATGAPVVMVTQQYDGIADAPAYPLNLVADLNALLGAYYLHGGGTKDSVGPYSNVDPNADGNIITTSGNMTDILVPAAPGALPLFIPLAQAGIPQPILVALDPAVRAIIETGYNRTTDPSQQVQFALLPPPSAWATDAQNVAAGFAQSAQELPGAVLASLPSGPTPVVTPPSSLTSVSQSTPLTGSTTNLSNPSGPQTFSQVQQNIAPKLTIVSGGDAGPLTPTPNTSTSRSQQSSATLPSLRTNPITNNKPLGTKPTSRPTSTGSGTPSQTGDSLQGAVTNVKKAIGSLTGGPKQSTSTSSTSPHTSSAPS